MFTCIDFATYEKLKTVICAPNCHFSSVMFCGICSSLVGIIICFPIGLVGVNLMAIDKRIRYSDFVEFVRKRGLRGMYSGLTAALIKGVPTCALSYVTYEQVIQNMGYRMV